MPDTLHLYLVVCGATQVIQEECSEEDDAHEAAAAHEHLHGCGAWVQPPLAVTP